MKVSFGHTFFVTVALLFSAFALAVSVFTSKVSQNKVTPASVVKVFVTPTVEPSATPSATPKLFRLPLKSVAPTK